MEPTIVQISAAASSLPKLVDLLVDADEKQAIKMLCLTDATGKSAFHMATKNNPECLKLMVERAGTAVAYKELTSTNSYGATALFTAASSGNVESLNIILDVAAKEGKLAKMVGTKDNQGKTILHHIMYTGMESCLKSVLERCAKKDLDQLLIAEDNAGRTPMHWGSHSQKSSGAMKYLLDHFGKKKAAELICEPNRTYIHRAAKYNYENLTAMLQLLSPKQITAIISRKENAGRNAIHSAMDHKDGQTIEELLKHINKDEAKKLILERNDEGVTAITMAVGNNFTDECLQIISPIVGKDKTIELLFDQDVSQKLNSGHNACLNAKTGPLEFILDLCGKQKSVELLTIKDSMEKTGIDYASLKTGHLQIIMNELSTDTMRELLTKVDNDGSTTIHRAGFSNPETLEMIIDLLGKDEAFELMKLKDSLGETAMHLIASERCRESFRTLIDMLEEEQVVKLLSQTNGEGDNGLQEAAKNQELDMINIILELVDQEHVQALIHHKNNKNQTALHLAAISANSEGLISLFEMLEYKDALALLCENDNDKWNAAHYAAKDEYCLEAILSTVKEEDLNNVVAVLRTGHDYNVIQIAAMANSKHMDRLKKYSTRKDGEVKLRHVTNKLAVNALHQIVIDYGPDPVGFSTKLLDLQASKWNQVTTGDINKQTPVHYLAKHAVPGCLKALNFAMGYQKDIPEMSKLLLMKDDSNETPVQAARNNGQCEEMWAEMEKFLTGPVEHKEFEKEKSKAKKKMRQEKRVWLPNIEKQGMGGAGFGAGRKF